MAITSTSGTTKCHQNTFQTSNQKNLDLHILNPKKDYSIFLFKSSTSYRQYQCPRLLLLLKPCCYIVHFVQTREVSSGSLLSAKTNQNQLVFWFF
ncbi:hypothetical protein JHK85_058131 [Glycine max]|nr:hypothetical protein JHK87_057382 [Glycine soja]KAG4919850.1 hypothetical protein JHK85_058131 [Glycine max]